MLMVAILNFFLKKFSHWFVTAKYNRGNNHRLRPQNSFYFLKKNFGTENSRLHTFFFLLKWVVCPISMCGPLRAACGQRWQLHHHPLHHRCPGTASPSLTLLPWWWLCISLVLASLRHPTLPPPSLAPPWHHTHCPHHRHRPQHCRPDPASLSPIVTTTGPAAIVEPTAFPGPTIANVTTINAATASVVPITAVPVTNWPLVGHAYIFNSFLICHRWPVANGFALFLKKVCHRSTMAKVTHAAWWQLQFTYAAIDAGIPMAISCDKLKFGTRKNRFPWLVAVTIDYL